MRDIVFGIWTAVYIEVFHIEILAAVVAGFDAHGLSVVEMKIYRLEDVIIVDAARKYILPAP